MYDWTEMMIYYTLSCVSHEYIMAVMANPTIQPFIDLLNAMSMSKSISSLFTCGNGLSCDSVWFVPNKASFDSAEIHVILRKDCGNGI